MLHLEVDGMIGFDVVKITHFHLTSNFLISYLNFYVAHYQEIINYFLLFISFSLYFISSYDTKSTQAENERYAMQQMLHREISTAIYREKMILFRFVAALSNAVGILRKEFCP